MFNINPVVFVPENVRYLSRQSSISEESFLTLDEKIKRDPVMREKYRSIAKITGQIDPQRRTVSGARPVQRPAIGQQQVARQSQPVNPQLSDNAVNDPNAPKEWLMNLTESDILFDWCVPKMIAGSRDAIPKPPVLKRFMHKSMLTEEQLAHPQLKFLVQKNIIREISEYEKMQADQFWANKDAKDAQIMDKRRQLAAYDRATNPHRSSDLRSISRVDIQEVDMTMGEPVQQGLGIRPDAMRDFLAATADGQNIQFGSVPLQIGEDLQGRRSLSREESEMNSLISQIPTERVDPRAAQRRGPERVDAVDLAGMFSIGEYKE